MMQAMAETQETLKTTEFPDSRSEFFLRGPAGKLECVTDVPAPADERPATVVICHPHPVHGGTMHNKVVTIMERSMRELGLRTVRFKFRCAGESEGEHDADCGGCDIAAGKMSFHNRSSSAAGREFPLRGTAKDSPSLRRLQAEVRRQTLRLTT